MIKVHAYAAHDKSGQLSPFNYNLRELILGQHSLSVSPLGSPATTQDMLAFCVGHNIQPVTEHFAVQDVNQALSHLRSGKARYRIVLNNEV